MAAALRRCFDAKHMNSVQVTMIRKADSETLGKAAQQVTEQAGITKGHTFLRPCLASRRLTLGRRGSYHDVRWFCPSTVHKQARQLESVASQMRDQGNKLEACMGILIFCFCLLSCPDVVHFVCIVQPP